MLNTPADKYQPYPTLSLPDRRWPEQRITRAPRWLSTDLRDGNQALAEPMDSTRKLQFWDLLLGCGFKEIEVAFPSASQTDFNFVRQLIEENRIPDDVTIQVLTQAREDVEHLLHIGVDAGRIQTGPRVEDGHGTVFALCRTLPAHTRLRAGRGDDQLRSESDIGHDASWLAWRGQHHRQIGRAHV